MTPFVLSVHFVNLLSMNKNCEESDCPAVCKSVNNNTTWNSLSDREWETVDVWGNRRGKARLARKLW